MLEANIIDDGIEEPQGPGMLKFTYRHQRGEPFKTWIRASLEACWGNVSSTMTPNYICGSTTTFSIERNPAQALSEFEQRTIESIEAQEDVDVERLP